MKIKQDTYKMHLAIVGSRNYKDYSDCVDKINKTLLEWNIDIKNIDSCVSGGAQGADTLAERWAKENNIRPDIKRPDWNAHGKAAGIIRNTDIVNACTHIIAFPSKSGRGTQDSIRKALKLKKVVKEFYID